MWNVNDSPFIAQQRMGSSEEKQSYGIRRIGNKVMSRNAEVIQKRWGYVYVLQSTWANRWLVSLVGSVGWACAGRRIEVCWSRLLPYCAKSPDMPPTGWCAVCGRHDKRSHVTILSRARSRARYPVVNRREKRNTMMTTGKYRRRRCCDSFGHEFWRVTEQSAPQFNGGAYRVYSIRSDLTGNIRSRLT